MKSTFLLMIFFISLIIPSLTQENKSIAYSNSTGKIKGSVFDSSGEAVMPGMEIVVEGENIKRTAFTNDDGEYEFNLPAGIYKISIEEKPHYERIYPFRRGKLLIHPDTTTIINLYPTLIGKIIELVATRTDVRDRVTILTKPPKYESYFNSSVSGINLLLQFDKKTIHRKIIEYKDATISYNSLTIIAGQMEFDKNTLQIKGKRVLIDDNGQKRRANKVTLELKNGLPIFH